jgi:FtsP/CotA-like multicopper oxidase with cupredoxin domain
VHVPDSGAYWYHPHIREDYGQELGLYGNILVASNEADYRPPVNRELLLTLDILIEDGKIAAFSEAERRMLRWAASARARCVLVARPCPRRGSLPDPGARRRGRTEPRLEGLTNPGRWMAHCHIAEHHESGMMFSFNVAPAEVGGAGLAAPWTATRQLHRILL